MKKGTSKASSAKAAAWAAADVGVGFGGFLGGQALSPAASSTATTGAGGGSTASGDVGGDIAQHLKRLTKREAVTRVKALQALRGLLQEQGDGCVAAVLPQWAHVFPRLVLDNDRSVRQEAADVMRLLAQAGRKLAPFLRVLLPPWWLLRFDQHADTAVTAQSAMQAAFPGAKQRGAILFCRSEVVGLLEDNLAATPEQLGDAARESSEELAQRHERVVAASLLALAALADIAAAPEDAMRAASAVEAREDMGQGVPAAAGGAAVPVASAAELLQRVAAIVNGAGFWKRTYGSKSPVVRQAAYSFTAQLAAGHASMLEASLAASAPMVLGAFSEKHAPNHGAMWEAVLTYCRRFPTAWDSVDVPKVVLPRLVSFLSHACYGSFETSHPALLPFLSCMPARLSLAAPRQPAAIAAALWKGCEALPPSARAAAATCYQECFCFLLARAEAAAALGASGAAGTSAAAASSAEQDVSAAAGSSAVQLLHAALCQGPVETALLPGSPGLAAMGAEAVAAVLTQLGGRAQAPGTGSGGDAALEQLLRAVGASMADNLRHSLQQAGSGADAVCDLAAAQLASLAEAGGGAHRQLVARCVVPPVAGLLLPSVSSGEASPAASRLLAAIVQCFGPGSVPSSDSAAGGSPDTPGSSSSLNPGAIVDKVLAGGSAAAASPAQAHLLAVCLAQRPDAAAAGGAALLRLAGAKSGSLDADSRSRGLDMACMLLDQLWPQATAKPAVPDGRRSVTFANPAAPSAAVSSPASLAQTDPSSWRSEDLDRLAVTLAEPDLLSAQPAAQRLLGRLLAGLGPLPPIGEPPALAALDSLHHAVRRGLVDQPGDAPGAAAAAAALHALDGCLYAVALGASPQLAARRALLLARVLQLTWQADAAAAAAAATPAQPDAGAHQESAGASEADSDAGSDAGSEADEADASAAQREAAAAARLVWSQGQRTADLLQHVSAEDAAAATSALTECLARSMTASMPHHAEDPAWADTWAARVEELHGVLEASPPAASQLIAAVLAPRRAWPRFAAATGVALLQGGPAAPAPDGEATAMDALVAALAARLGAAAVFGGGDGEEPRAWLLEELLCSAHGAEATAGSAAQAAQLLTTVVDQLEGQVGQELLASLLDRLWDNCTFGSVDSQTARAAATTATLQQLARLGRSRDAAAAALCGLSAHRLRPPVADTLLPPGLLRQFVSLLAAFVREDASGQRLETSGLADYAAAACAAAAALPPVAVCAAEGRPQTGHALDALRLAVACFPAAAGNTGVGSATAQGSTWGTGPASAADERAALLALLRRQLAGERAATAARLAERRLRPAAADAAQDSPTEPLQGSRSEQDATAVVTSLALAALTHCWQDVSEQEWDALFKRTHASLAAACVALEDIAEAVSSAAVAAAYTAASSPPEGAEAAVLLLHQLGRMSLLDVPPGPPVAAALRRDGQQTALREWHQDHARVFALLASKFEGAGRPTDVPSSWADFAADAAADVLRMLFAGATVQALAAAAGPEALRAAAEWQAACAPLWTAVADVALTIVQQPAGSALAGVVAPAVEAADNWAPETGVDAVGGLLALVLAPAAMPVPRLRTAALQALLAPGLDLLARLSTAPLISEEEAALAEEAAEAAGSGAQQDATARLVSAGVRPALAAALAALALGGPEPDAADGSEDGSGDSNEVGGGGSWLAGAALMAGHLLGLPPGSAGRRLLAQTLRDIHSLVPALLDALVDALPLQRASPSAAQRRSSGQGTKSDAAATDASVGQWRYVDELRAAGSADALTAAAYRGLLLALPASAALWFGDLRDRGTASAVEAYTRAVHTPVLLAHELAVIQSPAARELADADSFSLKANPTLREVVAVAQVEDGAVLELAIRLPPAWPLKPAEVECRRKVGVGEGRLRKWLLSISAFLRNQNGSILDAMSLWKANVDQAFQGVEECLICYSIVHPSNGQLPRMACRTCAKRFHAACLYRWFQSAAKSSCPHCQSQWLHGR